MEVSTLKPFVRPGLDILFVGLNPANGSSTKGHYFSVNQAFWNQLYDSGLLTSRVDKGEADQKVFGSTGINANGWNYGITDLVIEVAESDSTKVTPTSQDCKRLIDTIRINQPGVVVLLHSKVRDLLVKHLGLKLDAPFGLMGRWVDTPSEFVSVPFPHGNAISSIKKVEIYREILKYLLNNKT